MSDAQKLLANKKYPGFITTHKIWKSTKEIKKIFPQIGLPNCEKEVEIDNRDEAIVAANAMVSAIRQLINTRLQKLAKYGTKKQEKIGPKRKVKFSTSEQLLTEVGKVLGGKDAAKCIVVNNGRVTINLPADISINGKPVYKAGEGLFRVYNKLNDVLREGHFLAMEKLENVLAFKDFSTKNVPALKYKIRFSSDGEEGLWDIATMSMRGIESCQSWVSGNSTHIVGSMVDPFTGIIYLTSGAKHNDYGSRMIRRSVVRFIVNEKTKKPFIGIERMYPALEKGALNHFISLIRERTDNKFDVVYLPEKAQTGNYVPMSKIVNSLPTHEQPYRDSALPYKADVNDKKGRLKEQLQTSLDSFFGSFASKVVAAARGIKINSVPKDSRPAFKDLRGGGDRDHSYYVYQDLYAMVKKEFEKISLDNYDDPEAFFRDSIESFVQGSLENNILAVIKSYSKKYGGKMIDEAILNEWAKLAADKIVSFGKDEVNRLIAKKKGIVSKNDAESVIPTYVALLH